jgi:hypothetical protein
MPIGYIGNLANLQQGNQQVINSLAGLGQQIGNAIETHAATQSAQAMLPMLQQKYKQGLDKIAAGDSSGLGDVYQASMIASQNPILAAGANHAINLANMANVQTQHGLRTLAAQQGAMARANMKYNASSIAKPMTGGQKANITAKYRSGIMGLWDGTTDNPGAKNDVDAFLENKDPQKVNAFIQKLNQYNALKNESGVSDPNFENVLMAKQAIASGADPAKVIEKYKSLGTATKSVAPSITTPPAANPKQAPVQIPAGLQINPQFNTGSIAPSGGMIPAASGALQGTLADYEVPESDLEDQREDLLAESA